MNDDIKRIYWTPRQAAEHINDWLAKMAAWDVKIIHHFNIIDWCNYFDLDKNIIRGHHNTRKINKDHLDQLTYIAYLIRIKKFTRRGVKQELGIENKTYSPNLVVYEAQQLYI